MILSDEGVEVIQMWLPPGAGPAAFTNVSVDLRATTRLPRTKAEQVGNAQYPVVEGDSQSRAEIHAPT